jgi:hypothetical protein
MKIVINRCYGGFGLSPKAVMRYAELKGFTLYQDDSSSLVTSFYKVPVDEYKNMYSEAVKSKDYSHINGLYFSERNIDRDDSVLVQVVEELGEEAWGKYAELAVVEIPDDVQWEIDEYDGMERVAERYRTWG